MGAEGLKTWTEKEFDSLCWHDNRIQGIGFVTPKEGYDNEFFLIIDHILEWIPTPEGRFRFAVAPACISFRDAAKIVIEAALGYREHLTIDRIEREEISTEAQRRLDYRVFRWTIFLQSLDRPNSRIVLESPGFLQELMKPPVVQDSQWLDAEENTKPTEGSSDSAR